MGIILNKTIPNNAENLERLSPNDATWVTAHADVSGLAVVEIERLWKRFQQINNSNTKTTINIDQVATNAFGNDIFVRNFFKHFPRSRSNQEEVPFINYVMVMKWLENADTKEKLKAIFHYINNGKPITAPMVGGLLKHIYPETNDETIKKLSNELIEKLGPDSTGSVNEEQFITGVQRYTGKMELENILRFEIIPSEVLNSDDFQSPQVTSRSQKESFRSFDANLDNELRQIASRAATRNWQPLVMELGFYEYDIEAYKARNSFDSKETLLQMLEQWYYEDPSPSRKRRLRQALAQSGFQDLANILD